MPNNGGILQVGVLGITLYCVAQDTYFNSLFFLDQWKRMSKVLKSAGHALVPVHDNLINVIWADRPPRPCKPLMTLGLNYTG